VLIKGFIKKRPYNQSSDYYNAKFTTMIFVPSFMLVSPAEIVALGTSTVSGDGDRYRNARCGRNVLYSARRCILLGMISNSGGEDLAFAWIDKLLPTKIIGGFRRL
jgi:hypothetical protein